MGKYVTAVRGPLALPAHALLTEGQQEIARQSGRVIPAAVPVRFLIDTGSGHRAIVGLLLAQGADKQLKASDGATALDLAKKKGYEETAGC